MKRFAPQVWLWLVVGLALLALIVPALAEGLAPTSFMPHGHCYYWLPGILWLHTASDALIFLAYLSIPGVLAWFLRKRPDLPYPMVFWLFVAFIVLCGLTHGASILTTWKPLYWAAGWLKALTALVSVATAAVLIPTLPRALALRSPAELEAVNRELQRTVDELSDANRELGSVNAALNSAQQEMQDFAHIASHDLRSPLRGISMLLSWLEEDYGESMPPEARELVATGRGRAQRLDQMVQALLAYARAEHDVAERERFDPTEAARELELMLPPGGAFSLELEGSPGPVTLTRVPWTTALRNLVSNSIKHHDRSDGSVHVRLSLEGDELVAVVDDDGPGVPAAARERIFQPFTTLRPRDEVEGSGMGLAFVRRIASRHGGSVTVTDPPSERGARFVLRWPVT